MYEINLKGKVALVTGGYRGLGEAASVAFAKAGADIVIAARSFDKCEQKANQIKTEYDVNTLALRMDVGNAESVKKGVEEIVSSFGHIDILVNSAGISGVLKPVVQLSESEFNEVFNVDFKGVFLVCREVAKVMIQQKSGRIINVSSIAGKIAAPSMSGYCVSKAAVIHFSKVLAVELSRYGISVNVLCPGYFLTDMNRDFFETEKGKQLIKERIPIRRLGNIEEIESTFLYLASAPSFLTGAEIVVDGAQSII